MKYGSNEIRDLSLGGAIRRRGPATLGTCARLTGRPQGTIAYRCAGEPVSVYLSKGGKAEDTADRFCLCNALVANIGLPQVRGGKYVEKGKVTSGDDRKEILSFLPVDRFEYSASDVIAKRLEA